MMRTRLSRRFFWGLILGTVLASLAQPAFAASTEDDSVGQSSSSEEPSNGRLGIAVFLTPGVDVNGDGLEQTNRLWFALEAGTSASRLFKVSSTSLVTQNVVLSTVAGAREAGSGLTQEPAREDPISEWFEFSPKEFELRPGESRDVEVTVRAPLDAEESVVENFVKVRATGVATSDAQYRIPTAVSFVQPSMVIVGDAEQLEPSFEIVDVEGFRGDEGPMLRIYFQNSGGVPLSLSGTVQLSSLEFDGVRTDPLEFRSAVFLPGQGSFADVQVADPVSTGRWRIFVAAFQGSFKKSATFERDLTFDSPPSGPDSSRKWDIQRILIILLSITLFVFALRNLQGSSSSGVDEKETESSTSLDFSKLLVRLRKNWDQWLAAVKEQQQLEKVSDSSSSGRESVDVESREHLIADSIRDEVEIDVEVDEADYQPAPSNDDLISQNAEALRVLKTLRDEGVITREDYAQKRKEILSRF